MSLSIPFDNSYARLPSSLFSEQAPTPVRAPKLIAFNAALAADLGIAGAEDADHLAQVFSGSILPDGAQPLAQLYAAHQFGHWNPNLGDGRAILIGESNGYDIQLKGSGRTPYSRQGDGRAWLGPVLREYVISEFMFAAGIPTTRALAAVQTGEDVYRDKPLPGAVLTRTASSHIRVGTFQALAARQDIQGLQALLQYAIERHYPMAANPLEFLQEVIAAQANLIARWMSIGFIHGVMNTDNCAISGETIDYGPCAFMDNYHPMTVFSSIDRQGRYAFGNQPDIIVWNMAQLATALLPLMPDTQAAVAEFTDAVHAMPALVQTRWLHHFRPKIGLRSEQSEDAELIKNLLDHMTQSNSDFTNTFRELPNEVTETSSMDSHLFGDWIKAWKTRLSYEKDDPIAVMNSANPAVIPRNHQIEAMIAAAVDNNYAPFHDLMRVLSAPHSPLAPQDIGYSYPPKEKERVLQTFCGT